MSDNKLYQELASIQHDIWSHWMKYMFSQGVYKDGDWVMPSEKVERWTGQMNISYRDLTDQEQKSDQEQVDKFWHLIMEIRKAAEASE